MTTIILVNSDNPYKVIGGKSPHTLHFFDAIKEKGYNSYIATLDKPISKKNPFIILSYAKFKIFASKHPFIHPKNSRFLFWIQKIEDSLLKSIKKILKNLKDEKIYFIGEDVTALNAITKAGVPKERTFGVMHGYLTYEALDSNSLVEEEADLEVFYQYEKQAYEHCNAIVAVDSAIKDYLVNKMSVDNEKVKIIYNAIDIKKFHADFTEKERYKRLIFEGGKFPQKKFLILVARRLVNKNGVIYAVMGMKELRSISPSLLKDSLMIICGDGPEREKITQYVKNNELNEKVILVGNVIHDEIPDYYKAADVIVVSSIYTEAKFAEATSLTALEAMSSHSAVIVSNVGGLKEIVKNEETGYVVKEKSGLEIAEKIKYILDPSNEEKVKQVIKNSYQYLKSEHDPIRHSEKILKYFKMKLE